MLDQNILADGKSSFGEALLERAEKMALGQVGSASEKSDLSHLLSATRERPRRRAAQECHKFAPPHPLLLQQLCWRRLYPSSFVNEGQNHS